MGFLEFKMELDISYYLVLENMMPLTKGLDITKKWYYICFFSSLCENQNWFLWFFTYRKKLTFHPIVILIKSNFNKNQNSCYYNIFSEKCSYQLAKTSDNK